MKASPNKLNASVAVIMRTKDRPLLLERALTSALRQNYPNLEIIIINDGGDPKPVNAIVNTNAPFAKSRTVKVLHNKESLGMEAASNLGINSTDTDLIAILDDDDRWHEDYLIEAINYLHINNYEGVVTYSKLFMEKIEGDKVTVLEERPYLPTGSAISLYELFARNTFPTNAFVFTRNAYQEVGGYDETLPVLGDWDFNIRFASLFEIGVLQKPLAYVHQRKMNDKDFGNTVIAQRETHLKYAQLVRNKFLRQDLADKTLGAGYFMNMLGDPAVGLVAEVSGMSSENKVHFTHISDRVELLAKEQSLNSNRLIEMAQQNLQILHENTRRVEFASSNLTGLGHKAYRKLKSKRSEK